ncbi:hypothetical protein P152DRAFT_455757 [Eremomyces bilateralis CBS 781.70]|uniref:Uncharacterized protein n=1 Tax=Eremomyces bilateralis CBS 781.70 TaxID=1392243 RepID=A0A6G1G9F6_9PEZI|nr:uncharacterized protein P152DRAFT_455757 [Eremomyces bilateralis CBS 781.70]KAF1814718.1 hypothetical protein P152DRAFT_455757 [Eremomyces bilateralis CBS 781.70]
MAGPWVLCILHSSTLSPHIPHNGTLCVPGTKRTWSPESPPINYYIILTFTTPRPRLSLLHPPLPSWRSRGEVEEKSWMRNEPEQAIGQSHNGDGSMKENSNAKAPDSGFDRIRCSLQ